MARVRFQAEIPRGWAEEPSGDPEQRSALERALLQKGEDVEIEFLKPIVIEGGQHVIHGSGTIRLPDELTGPEDDLNAPILWKPNDFEPPQ
jgi:hypothetical protein